MATERRARKANRKAIIAARGRDPPPGGESSRSPSLKDEAESPVESIIPALNVSTEEQASCHFLSNYVLVPRDGGGTRGYMEFIVPLMNLKSGNAHLRQAFTACAMASLGNRANAYGSKLSSDALIEYTKALQSTHAALKDPVQSLSDSTLAAVLMLGLFEVCRWPLTPVPESADWNRTSRRSKSACWPGAPTSKAPFTL